MTWDEIAVLIDGTTPAHLATSDATGHPHVAVVSPGVDGQDLVFLTGTGSAKAHNLRANPYAAFVFSGNGAETYIWGGAELTSDVDAKRAIWNGGTLPYDPAGFFGAPEKDSVVLVRVNPTRATVVRHGPDGPGRYTWTA
jgi:general stress protein 26